MNSYKTTGNNNADFIDGLQRYMSVIDYVKIFENDSSFFLMGVGALLQSKTRSTFKIHVRKMTVYLQTYFL